MENNLDRWRKIILDEMKCTFKSAGFHQQGQIFRKLLGDVWQVAQLQSSQWNDQTCLTVFANVGLCYGREAKSISNPKAGPKAYECHWGARVPGSGRVQCWDIRSDGEAHTAAAEIATGSFKLLNAALERYPDADRVFDAYKKNGITVDRDLSPWAHAYPGLILREKGLDAGLMSFEPRTKEN